MAVPHYGGRRGDNGMGVARPLLASVVLQICVESLPVFHVRTCLPLFLAVRYFGLPAARVAGALGVSGMAIIQAIARGLEDLRARCLNPDRLAKAALRKVN